MQNEIHLRTILDEWKKNLLEHACSTFDTQEGRSLPISDCFKLQYRRFPSGVDGISYVQKVYLPPSHFQNQRPKWEVVLDMVNLALGRTET